MSLKLDPVEAWNGAIMKMERCLHLWRGRALSLHGKAVVLKHFAYPTISYLAQTLPIQSPAPEGPQLGVEILLGRQEG